MKPEKLRKMIELARGHVEAGGFTAADIYYRMVIEQTTPPVSGLDRLAHGEACMFEARKALAQNALGTACDWYRRAVNADPLAIHYRSEYIIKALVPMNLMKNARIEAERNTRIDPNDADAWRTLGMIAHAQGDAEACIAAHDRELELDPGAVSKLDRAGIALDLADYDKVEDLAGEALADKKHHGNALHFLAMAAYRRGKHQKAIDLFDRALAAGVDDPALVEWNKSLSLHSLGRYKEGWKAHEARFKQTMDHGMALLEKRFVAPVWKGEPGEGKKLHLHQEMGYGDVIAMLRYIPMLLGRGFEVTIELQDSLIDLVRRSFPAVRVIQRALDYPGALGVPMFDYHLPMLSLPAVFETDIDTVPWGGPYLVPDPEKVKKYSDFEGCVGICWSSGVRHESLWLQEYGTRKSMHFSDVRDLCLEHGDFVSLVVGPERAQNRVVDDPLPAAPSWDDTAALVANLDLVITVDTSIAHLAGAMGKETWVMMHTEGSWHWMTKRLDSPWYPSARLFRQQHPHEWRDVVASVKEALTHRRTKEVAHAHPVPDLCVSNC